MQLKDSKIIVIKIGSSLLVDHNKKIRKKWLSSFAKDIKKLRSKNKKIVNSPNKGIIFSNSPLNQIAWTVILYIVNFFFVTI